MTTPTNSAARVEELLAEPVAVNAAAPSAGAAAESLAGIPMLSAGRPTTLTTVNPSPEFRSLIPHEFARRHLVLSEGCVEGTEQLVISSATKPTAPFNVGVRLGRPVVSRVAAAEEIAAAVDRVYLAPATGADDGNRPNSDLLRVVVEGSSDVETDLESAVRDAEGDLLHTHGKAPVVRLVDLVLFEALLRSASDVHIQPVRDSTLVRYRLDGALHTVRRLPGSLASAVVSRIKVMARLDVAERRAPQDGRATVTIGGAGAGGMGGQQGRRVDLRISTLPSTYGERVVIRLLDPTRSPHLSSFQALGMPAAVQKRYLEQASRTSGIVLSTGPTGSGKTTTLYATLAWLSAVNSAGGLQATNAAVGGRGGCELNIMTIEDPVEYDLSGPGESNPADSGATGRGGLSISQTQVDPKKNVGFATGLRHILRQDPDVIMVGEIRDEETARIAVQASLTGHLVLSTLHTNDAASAVARLIDLNVEPFLVSSALAAVLAQRLVRQVHRPCEGRGCTECLGTGFKGRTGVFELLVMDPALRALVGRHASAAELKAAAQASGMVTLKQAGEDLVAQGLTTRTELARVVETMEDEVAV